MPTVIRKIFTDETEEELIQMKRKEVTLELNDKQIAFCENYVKNYNIRLAAIKAGYSAKSAHIIGWKLRQNPDINRYIAWLKLKVSRACHVEATDIVDQYTRIGFADINDFVEIINGRVKLRDSSEIDGQLIKTIKSGPNGVTVELKDSLAALDKLERYFDVMPKDWKQKIEEKKLEIAEKHLEIERIKAGLDDDESEDDGFIEALQGTVEEVWEGDEDNE